MGAGNVKAAYGVWSHLPDPAFRLLVFMALVTKDEDDPPIFWGGRETQAIGIGRKPPHTAADMRAVERAVTKLREAGAIELVQHSAPGHTARHALHLSPVARRRVSEDDTRHDTSGEHPTPHVVNTRRAVTQHPTRGDRTPDAWRGPEEEQEPQGLTQDQRLIQEPHLQMRAKAAPRRCSEGSLIAADGACCEVHEDAS
jgi:hypothetical protein